jgi:hypothetical protein
VEYFVEVSLRPGECTDVCGVAFAVESSVEEKTAPSAVATELPVGQISVIAVDDAQNKPQDLEHRNKGVITV